MGWHPQFRSIFGEGPTGHLMAACGQHLRQTLITQRRRLLRQDVFQGLFDRQVRLEEYSKRYDLRIGQLYKLVGHSPAHRRRMDSQCRRYLGARQRAQRPIALLEERLLVVNQILCDAAQRLLALVQAEEEEARIAHLPLEMGAVCRANAIRLALDLTIYLKIDRINMQVKALSLDCTTYSCVRQS